MNKATFLLVLLAVSFVAATEHVEENNAADELVRQINSMQSAIRAEQADHTALWESQSVDCNNEIAFRNQEVTDATTALENSRSAQDREEVALAGARLGVAQATGYIEAVNDILQNLLVQRTTEHAHYLDVLNNQLNPAIDAVNGVYPLLDALSQQVSEANSFVQVRNHINKSFVKMIKAQKGVQFTTILAELLAAPAVGVSQDTVDRLTRLFDQLAEDLNQARTTLVQNEADAQAVYDETVAKYDVILDGLNQTVQNLNDYIDTLTAALQTEAGIQASASAKQARNQDALDHAVDMCAAFATEYDNSTQARTDEVNLLNKLKAFVRDQEELFGNYGVDGVDALSEYQKSFAETKAQNRANFLQLALTQQKKQVAPVVPAAKCESCQKSFLQKRLGF